MSNAVKRESYHDYMGRRMKEDKENEVVSPYGGLGAPSKTLSLANLWRWKLKL